MSDRPDVVLLTVDCWRYDAVSRMTRLKRLARGALDRTEAVCQSAATPGVFPALLGSTYYSAAYDSSGALRADVSTLPEVLGEAGYETAAVVGNNPFLEKFRGEFDYFWNGGSGTEGSRRAYHYLRRQVRRRVRHRSTVPATTVADRGREWFTSTEGPRLLVMHLMDPHEPYYPGLKRWLGVGPVRARRALAQFQEDRLSMTDGHRETIERLYWGCVDFVDRSLRSLLAFVPDDALLVVTADHGEEFDHGAYRHARLYDECVRVPLFTRNLPGVAATDRLRQLDLSPSVLSRLGLEPPDDWVGRPADGTVRPSFMLNHSPHRDEQYLGLRTDRYKLIRTVDLGSDGRTDTELYDLATDPRETRDLSGTDRESGTLESLTDRLDEFRTRHDVETGITRGTGSRPESTPEDQLEALGYV